MILNLSLVTGAAETWEARSVIPICPTLLVWCSSVVIAKIWLINSEYLDYPVWYPCKTVNKWGRKQNSRMWEWLMSISSQYHQIVQALTRKKVNIEPQGPFKPQLSRSSNDIFSSQPKTGLYLFTDLMLELPQHNSPW